MLFAPDHSHILFTIFSLAVTTFLSYNSQVVMAVTAIISWLRYVQAKEVLMALEEAQTRMYMDRLDKCIFSRQVRFSVLMQQITIAAYIGATSGILDQTSVALIAGEKAAFPGLLALRPGPLDFASMTTDQATQSLLPSVAVLVSGDVKASGSPRHRIEVPILREALRVKWHGDRVEFSFDGLDGPAAESQLAAAESQLARVLRTGLEGSLEGLAFVEGEFSEDTAAMECAVHEKEMWCTREVGQVLADGVQAGGLVTGAAPVSSSSSQQQSETQQHQQQRRDIGALLETLTRSIRQSSKEIRSSLDRLVSVVCAEKTAAEGSLGAVVATHETYTAQLLKKAISDTVSFVMVAVAAGVTTSADVNKAAMLDDYAKLKAPVTFEDVHPTTGGPTLSLTDVTKQRTDNLVAHYKQLEAAKAAASVHDKLDKAMKVESALVSTQDKMQNHMHTINTAVAEIQGVASLVGAAGTVMTVVKSVVEMSASVGAQATASALGTALSSLGLFTAVFNLVTNVVGFFKDADRFKTESVVALIAKETFEAEMSFKTCSMMADAYTLLETQHSTFRRYAAVADREIEKLVGKEGEEGNLPVLSSSHMADKMVAEMARVCESDSALCLKAFQQDPVREILKSQARFDWESLRHRAALGPITDLAVSTSPDHADKLQSMGYFLVHQFPISDAGMGGLAATTAAAAPFLWACRACGSEALVDMHWAFQHGHDDGATEGWQQIEVSPTTFVRYRREPLPNMNEGSQSANFINDIRVLDASGYSEAFFNIVTGAYESSGYVPVHGFSSKRIDKPWFSGKNTVEASMMYILKSNADGGAVSNGGTAAHSHLSSLHGGSGGLPNQLLVDSSRKGGQVCFLMVTKGAGCATLPTQQGVTFQKAGWEIVSSHEISKDDARSDVWMWRAKEGKACTDAASSSLSSTKPAPLDLGLVSAVTPPASTAPSSMPMMMGDKDKEELSLAAAVDVSVGGGDINDDEEETLLVEGPGGNAVRSARLGRVVNQGSVNDLVAEELIGVDATNAGERRAMTKVLEGGEEMTGVEDGNTPLEWWKRNVPQCRDGQRSQIPVYVAYFGDTRQWLDGLLRCWAKSNRNNKGVTFDVYYPKLGRVADGILPAWVRRVKQEEALGQQPWEEDGQRFPEPDEINDHCRITTHPIQGSIHTSEDLGINVKGMDRADLVVEDLAVAWPPGADGLGGRAMTYDGWKQTGASIKFDDEGFSYPLFLKLAKRSTEALSLPLLVRGLTTEPDVGTLRRALARVLSTRPAATVNMEEYDDEADFAESDLPGNVRLSDVALEVRYIDVPSEGENQAQQRISVWDVIVTTPDLNADVLRGHVMDLLRDDGAKIVERLSEENWFPQDGSGKVDLQRNNPPSWVDSDLSMPHQSNGGTMKAEDALKFVRVLEDAVNDETARMLGDFSAHLCGGDTCSFGSVEEESSEAVATDNFLGLWDWSAKWNEKQLDAFGQWAWNGGVAPTLRSPLGLQLYKAKKYATSENFDAIEAMARRKTLEKIPRPLTYYRDTPGENPYGLSTMAGFEHKARTGWVQDIWKNGKGEDFRMYFPVRWTGAGG
jgi:hypothetical protein